MKHVKNRWVVYPVDADWERRSDWDREGRTYTAKEHLLLCVMSRGDECYGSEPEEVKLSAGDEYELSRRSRSTVVRTDELLGSISSGVQRGISAELSSGPDLVSWLPKAKVGASFAREVRHQFQQRKVIEHVRDEEVTRTHTWKAADRDRHLLTYDVYRPVRWDIFLHSSRIVRVTWKQSGVFSGSRVTEVLDTGWTVLGRFLLSIRYHEAVSAPMTVEQVQTALVSDPDEVVWETEPDRPMPQVERKAVQSSRSAIKVAFPDTSKHKKSAPSSKPAAPPVAPPPSSKPKAAARRAVAASRASSAQRSTKKGAKKTAAKKGGAPPKKTGT